MRPEVKEDDPRKGQVMVSIFLRGIPREVRDRFKALCVMRGTTMREAIVEMMLEALEGSPIPVPELPERLRGARPEHNLER
jgi:hypothetical protein